MSFPCLIVHIGAGNHSKYKTKLYRSLLRRSLKENNLENASEILERSILTNTGYGASLDLNGEVRCDASYLKVENDHIRGGSMYNINTINPINSVIYGLEKLDKLYHPKKNTFGLSKPIILNYDSLQIVNKFLVDDGQKVTNKEQKQNLISPIARGFYNKYRPLLFDNKNHNELIRVNEEITDTIGLIYISNSSINIASSSGGNFFKLPGRIGCAGIIGASMDFISKENMDISCICSGNGEQIIENKLANYLVNTISINNEENRMECLIRSLKAFSSNLYMHAPKQDQDTENLLYIGAIITIRNNQTGKINIIYLHSTESFYFGFKAKDSTPEIILNRLNKQCKPGRDFAYGEFIIK